MGIEINRPLGVSGLNTAFVPKYRPYFGVQQNNDTFERTSIDRFTSENAIRKMISANPRVQQIMREINAATLNMKELQALLKTHAAGTSEAALGIASHLPFALSDKANKQALKDAACLHDLGKVLIPPEVLNKPGRHDEKEAKIMHRHTELSYELLKTANIDPYTLNLIKNHHNYDKADLNLQILIAADKYSALTEKRVYKDAMPPKQALTIIYQDVKDGNLHPFVFRALVDYAKTIRHREGVGGRNDDFYSII
jgi:HD-GYP domain-containing protein (c-di-GMP phosphodiesterase class II)